MKQYNLKDITFIIPVHCDSIIRLENTISIISFLSKYFDSNIFVLEISDRNNQLLSILLSNKIRYYFLEEHDNIFHKTRYINILSKMVKTPYLAIWDADVIAAPDQVIDAIKKLRKNEADMAFPYDGRFLECSEIIRSLYLERGNIQILSDFSNLMDLPYGTSQKGGAVFLNLEKFFESGMANEDFYGWGNEDYELYHRFESLGFKTYNSKGPLYHLTHPRDYNGKFRSSNQVKWTRSQLAKVINSSAEELISQI